MTAVKKYTDIILIGLLAFFVFPMAQIIMQYIPYNTDVAFLRIKQQYISIDVWRWAFFIHVYSSLLVLFAGFSQFNKQLLKQHPALHRKLGYVYVLNVLFITGPASLIMGFYANGGGSSRIAFVLLAVLWLYFTYKAVMEARNKKINAHRRFMIRSFALTLSAITLRAWKYAITNTISLPPMDVYRIVAWLGWVVNLLIAEIYIRKKITKR